jgi:hypothetical protein
MKTKLFLAATLLSSFAMATPSIPPNLDPGAILNHSIQTREQEARLRKLLEQGQADAAELVGMVNVGNGISIDASLLSQVVYSCMTRSEMGSAVLGQGKNQPSVIKSLLEICSETDSNLDVCVQKMTCTVSKN